MEKEQYPSFEVFRGLQKPLVMFGLKGVNIVWGAGTFLGTLIMILIGFVVANLVVGIFLGLGPLAYGVYRIIRNMRKGLQPRKEYKGYWQVGKLIQR